jgi:uncharacterized protein (DUF697 family)
MLEKFTSRKFIIAVLTMLAGVVTALTGVGGEIGEICGVIAAIIAPVVYIIVEGNIDAKAVQLITEATESIVDYFDDEEETDTENNAEIETEAV